ncbi:unnamed protein product, partial [Prorocentrum cordatum]
GIGAQPVAGAPGAGERAPSLPAPCTAGGTVVVQMLQSGRIFGFMELMEGCPYQCSVVAAPMADVYVIGRNDLLRSLPKPVTHRLFCDYRARLSDERLMQRLKQKCKWNSYKHALLDEILTRRSGGATGRGRAFRDPPPRLAFGALEDSAYERIGRGEGLWDGRAQTPPRSLHALPAGPPQGAGHAPASGGAGAQFRVGDRVQVRGSVSQPWKGGEVVCGSPLRVLPDGGGHSLAPRAAEVVRAEAPGGPPREASAEDGPKDGTTVTYNRIVAHLNYAIHSGRRTLFNRPVRDVRTFFEALDRNGSGGLERSEIAQGLQRRACRLRGRHRPLPADAGRQRRRLGRPRGAGACPGASAGARAGRSAAWGGRGAHLQMKGTRWPRRAGPPPPRPQAEAAGTGAGRRRRSPPASRCGTSSTSALKPEKTGRRTSSSSMTSGTLPWWRWKGSWSWPWRRPASATARAARARSPAASASRARACPRRPRNRCGAAAARARRCGGPRAAASPGALSEAALSQTSTTRKSGPLPE